MRRTRILTVLLFLLAAACCVGYHFLTAAMTDSTPPVITMDSDTVTVSVEDGDEAVLQGVTAKDNRDGDVTSGLIIESKTNFVADSTRTVTIAAVDAAGNVSKVTRDVVYSDYVPTTFSLSAPLRFEVGDTNITANIYAYDCLDGDVSARVKLTRSYTLESAAGEYPMEFAVTNSAGDVSRLTATVTLYNKADAYSTPEIELNQYLIYTTVGEKIDAWENVKDIIVQGDTFTRRGENLYGEEASIEDAITHADVNVSDNVNYSEPGTYEITYSYTTPNMETGKVRLIVIVQ